VDDAAWQVLRDELAADVRRVSDRLRSLSEAQLAAPPAPPEGKWPPYRSRLQAGQGIASHLAQVAYALESRVTGEFSGGGVSMPALSPFAVGDMVAVTGNDLLAAMDLVGPDTPVPNGFYAEEPAADAVTRAARLLADVRRRI
jgi:hypothetical protein